MSKQKKSHEHTATTADVHQLYECSVQDTEITISMLESIFESRSERTPLLLREDFCGTAKLCCDWAASAADRSAIGLDIDRPTLEWGRTRNQAPLGAAAERADLRERDVIEGTDERSDITVAFNFSYCVFKDRDDLLAYFTRVFEDVAEGGVFVLDLQGGPDAQFALEEETEYDGFTYVWEQSTFNPINNHHICRIHFRFPDGGEIEDAFVYDWRLWTLPELRDVLEEAGFDEIDIWWDGEDDVLSIQRTAENFKSWIAYIAAWK